MVDLKNTIKRKMSSFKRTSTEPGFASKYDEEEIKEAQRATGAPGVVVHAELVGDYASLSPLTRAYNISCSTKTKDVSESTLFGYGSFQKTIIAVAMYWIIEEGVGIKEQGRKVKELMKDAWEKPVFAVVNELLEIRGYSIIPPPSAKSPTIKQTLQHESALAPNQRYLWGPEGSFLMGDDLFKEVVTGLIDREYGNKGSHSRYSSWNTILAAFIVTLACGSSLAAALRTTVLDRYKMTNTILSFEEFESGEHDIAEAFTTTFDNSECRRIPSPQHFSDTAELAVGGGYSCVEDIAKLLREILVLSIDPESRMNELLYSFTVKTEDGKYRSTICGLYAPLDSSMTGSQSFDHPWQKEVYKLERSESERVKAISKAGAVKGYSCHYYLIPTFRTFTIVMTNSSGILDPSNHISQCLIQQVLNLQPRVKNIGKKIRLIQEMKRKDLEPFFGNQSIGERLSSDDLVEYIGTFIHAESKQKIVIQRSQDGRIEVFIQGSVEPKKQTKNLVIMRKPDITKKGDVILSLFSESEDSSIDEYDSWRGLELKVVRRGSEVVSLEVVRAAPYTPSDDVYMREL
jgi:CubicO group peptidase (beta-lactamase class C family)